MCAKCFLDKGLTTRRLRPIEGSAVGTGVPAGPGGLGAERRSVTETAGEGSAPRDGTRTVTKKDLVNRIAERTGETKVVTKGIVQMFLDEIVAELGRGNRLEFRDFGVFEVRERRPRRAQNPRTLEKVDVPAKRVVKFKVGRILRERVTDAPAATESG